MPSLYSKFSTNKDLEETGRWVNFGDGIRVRVRRIRSRASVEARKQIDSPHTNEIRRGTLTEEQLKEMGLMQVAHGIIAAWEGVTDRDGNPVEFTPDAAFKILSDLPEFAEQILEVSMNSENYKVGEKGDAIKN